MEGGTMRPSLRTLRTLLILAGIAIVGALVTPNTFGQELECYVTSGQIEVLDKIKGIAVIDGVEWPLVEDFSSTNIEGDYYGMFSSDRTELRYPIEYSVAVPSGPDPIDSHRLLRQNVVPGEIPCRSPEIETIHENGGKIYQIYVPGS
jgi:hypothetical protein